MTEAVAWMYRTGPYLLKYLPPIVRLSVERWPLPTQKHWTEIPLYPAEALAAKDAKIAELERECDTLSGLVQGWHYLAVGPDEMGDYHTQKQLIELSEPYASPALKALKEKNDVA